METNSEKEEEVFGRKDALARTPPWTIKSRSLSFSDAISSLERSRAGEVKTIGEVQQLKKRRREEGENTVPPQENLITDLGEKLEKMVLAARRLDRLANKEVVNTHRGVKEATTRLLFDILETQHSWEKAQECVTKWQEKATAATAAAAAAAAATSTTSGKENVLQVLKNDTGYEALETVLKERWPAEAYSKTEYAKTEEEFENLEADIAIVLDPSKSDESRLARKYQARFNGLKEVIADSTDKIGFVLQTSRTSGNGTCSTKSRAVYVLPLKTGNEADATKRLYEVLKELPETMEINPVEKVKLEIGEGMEPAITRKVAEYACAKTNLRIVLRPTRPTKKPVPIPRTKARKEESVVAIKGGNSTYADLVKKIKENVNVNEIGVQINKIRRTEKGDVVLTVAGGEENAKTLKNEIQKKHEDLEITTRSQGKMNLFVMGMDTTTCEQDVKSGIATAQNIEEAKIRVLSLRTGRYDEKTAIVELPRPQATRLLVARKVKIGWINCAVRERIEVPRCYNCLEHGHRTKDCKAQTSKKDECLNCGEKGHKAKTCTNRPRCSKCGEEGHRSDQIKCPYFRKEVDKLRKLRLQAFSKGGKTERDGS